MLHFPAGWFDEEIREGFLVPSMMKKYWASQMEILMEMDRICKKHDITYFAASGTLLGAVRHKGFIPWDDDIDIALRRDDYNRFLSVAPRELKGDYQLVDCCGVEGTVIGINYFARLLNSSAIRTDKEFLTEFHGCPYISGIDIFPLDYTPQDEEESTVQRGLIAVVNKVAEDLARGKEIENLDGYIAWIEETAQCTFDTELPLYIQLFRLVSALSQMYSRNEAGAIGIIPEFREGEYYGVPVECYDEVMLLPFETIMVPAPVMYDMVLSAEFGDYMTPKKIFKDAYPLYKSQEQILIDLLKKSI